MTMPLVGVTVWQFIFGKYVPSGESFDYLDGTGFDFLDGTGFDFLE